MKLIIILLIILLTDFTIGTILSPAIVEAPIVQEVDILKARIRKLEALELWAVRNGVIVLTNGRVIRR